MTTARQIKSLFKALLQRHDDLVHMNSRSVWIKPIRHVAVLIKIHTSYNADNFEVYLVSKPTYFEPSYFVDSSNVHYHATHYESVWAVPPPEPLPPDFERQPKYWKLPEYVERERILSGQRRWRWSDPEIRNHFLAVVESDLLPRMRRMAADHVAFLDYHRTAVVEGGTASKSQQLAVAVAAGDLERALPLLEILTPSYEVDAYGDYEPPDPLEYPRRRTMKALLAYWKGSGCIDYRDHRRRYFELAEPLRRGDRAALASVLHRWEAERVRGAPYERFWEPTPFPIEEGSG